jgi:hypothetical protein
VAIIFNARADKNTSPVLGWLGRAARVLGGIEHGVAATSPGGRGEN